MFLFFTIFPIYENDKALRSYMCSLANFGWQTFMGHVIPGASLLFHKSFNAHRYLKKYLCAAICI